MIKEGAVTCVRCPVRETFGGMLVLSGTTVECCCATKAMIRCKIAVRAMALAAKKRFGGGWEFVTAVEGVCPVSDDWDWHKEKGPPAPSCRLGLRPPSQWGKAFTCTSANCGAKSCGIASPGTTSSPAALFLLTLVDWSCKGESACLLKLAATKIGLWCRGQR